MTTPFSKAAMRARYRELAPRAAALEAAAAPFRAERDRIAAEEGVLADRRRANRDAMRAAQEDLFDVENEMALIARALGLRGLIDETAADTQTVAAGDVGAMPAGVVG